jgi:hypothetical protein
VESPVSIKKELHFREESRVAVSVTKHCATAEAIMSSVISLYAEDDDYHSNLRQVGIV